MSEVKTGGPAFPSLNAEMTGIDSDGNERWDTEPSGGMTLRDYFAAKAMQSFLINSPPKDYDSPYSEWAEDAYQMADAMLEARNATE